MSTHQTSTTSGQRGRPCTTKITPSLRRHHLSDDDKARGSGQRGAKKTGDEGDTKVVQH